MEFSVTIRCLNNGVESTFPFPRTISDIGYGLECDGDFEYIIVDSSLDGMIREYDSIELLNEFYEKVEDVDDDLVLAYHEVTGYGVSEIVKEDVEFDDVVLLDEVFTERGLGAHFVDELGWEGIGKENMERYFDRQAYGRDINLENQGGFSSKGYVYIY